MVKLKIKVTVKKKFVLVEVPSNCEICRFKQRAQYCHLFEKDILIAPDGFLVPCKECKDAGK